MMPPFFARRGRLLALLALASLLVPSGASASHRAHLSADLSRKVADGAQSVNVIVQGDPSAIEGLAARYHVRVAHLMERGAVLTMSPGDLASLSADPGVNELSADSTVYPTADVTDETIGADQLWQGFRGMGIRGVDGRGVVVAVIDSGIDRVPGLRGRVLGSFDFVNGADGAPLHDPDNDLYGHGTHVAGLIAGQPADPVAGGSFSGVAPDAYLVNLRVLGADGSGQTSDVIDAIDWVIDHGARYGVRVINLSLGHPVFESYLDDPLCQAVERAVAAGYVVVAAAGNLGVTDDGTPVIGGITSPGNAPDALTVGALNTQQTAFRSDDTVATYSSRGPTAYDNLLKPDLVAPGNKIVSLEAPGSYLARTYPELEVAGHGRNGYFQLSGTSQATAVASGAVALLLDAEPGVSPAQVKALLQLSATYLPDAGLVGGGAGSLNVLAAVDLARHGLKGNWLPTTSIAGETVQASGVAFGMAALESESASSGASLIWGNCLIWGNTVVRGNSLIWGNTVVWGNTLIWGNTVVWGNTLIWGNTVVSGNSLIWGNTVSSYCLIWGNSLVPGE
jgi:serine protease AprX